MLSLLELTEFGGSETARLEEKGISNRKNTGR